jgi:phage tail-like protein
MSIMNPVANNNFSVFMFDAAPLDTSATGLASAGAGLAVGAAKSALFGSFSEVSGLDAGMEVEEYREGGNNTGPLQFGTYGTYSKVVLKRGTTPNADIWNWHYEAMYGTDRVPRKNGIIILTDKGLGLGSASGFDTGLGLPVLDKLPIAVWFFRRGLPELLQGPALNGSANEIAIESLEIAHEGLVRVGAGMIPGIGSALTGLGL